ncbi:hypothetical protein C8Q74DRAFT_1221328 [Fomes fomentarius]|nr:hypothetical protein C8Q74DRAFT_1221328 [Fomes fomentarius]
MGFLDGALNPLPVPVHNDTPQGYEPHLRKKTHMLHTTCDTTNGHRRRCYSCQRESLRCPSRLPVTLHYHKTSATMRVGKTGTRCEFEWAALRNQFSDQARPRYVHMYLYSDNNLRAAYQSVSRAFELGKPHCEPSFGIERRRANRARADWPPASGNPRLFPKIASRPSSDRVGNRDKWPPPAEEISTNEVIDGNHLQVHARTLSHENASPEPPIACRVLAAFSGASLPAISRPNQSQMQLRPPPGSVPHVRGLASWATLISLACGRTSSRLSPLMAHGCIPCEPRAALGHRIPFPAGLKGPEHDLDPTVLGLGMRPSPPPPSILRKGPAVLKLVRTAPPAIIVCTAYVLTQLSLVRPVRASARQHGVNFVEVYAGDTFSFREASRGVLYCWNVQTRVEAELWKNRFHLLGRRDSERWASLRDCARDDPPPMHMLSASARARIGRRGKDGLSLYGGTTGMDDFVGRLAQRDYASRTRSRTVSVPDDAPPPLSTDYILVFVRAASRVSGTVALQIPHIARSTFDIDRDVADAPSLYGRVPRLLLHLLSGGRRRSNDLYMFNLLASLGRATGGNVTGGYSGGRSFRIPGTTLLA